MDLRADDLVRLRGKLQLDVLAEARRVVVALPLRVVERLEQRIRLHNALRQSAGVAPAARDGWHAGRLAATAASAAAAAAAAVL